MKQKRQRERSLVERLLDDAIDAAFAESHASGRHDDTDSWRAALERCLERVPERGRSVLKARFVEELSYRRIAERVGMTLEAVRKALFRLKKSVRLCVETNVKEVPR